MQMSENLYIEFVKHSLTVQFSLAKQVSNHYNCDVYVFDAEAYFKDANQRTYNNIRFLSHGGKMAVLSSAAQNTFKISTDFKNVVDYVGLSVINDDIGYKIEPDLH